MNEVVSKYFSCVFYSKRLISYCTRRSVEASYPSGRLDDELADRFANFFTNEILAIRYDLSVKSCAVENPFPDSVSCPCHYTAFKKFQSSMLKT